MCGERHTGGFVEDFRHTSVMFCRAFCGRIPGKGIVSDRVIGDRLTEVTACSYSPGNGETLFVFYYMGTISCQSCNYFSVFSKVTFARYEDKLEVRVSSHPSLEGDARTFTPGQN